MRLKRSRLKTYYHKTAKIEKDREGGTSETYGSALSFSGEVWPAGGKVQAEMYGNRLSYIRNIRIDGEYTIQADKKGVLHYVYPNGLDIVEKDGLCLYVGPDADPDYRIISIKPERFLRLEAEKI